MKKPTSSDIKKFYSENVKYEWNRFDRSPYHKLEYTTTIYFLQKYLPKKGTILDAGGGPGRYTIALARKGYNIVLLDITPELLKFAEIKIKKYRVKNRVKNIIEGSITDLSQFEDNSFDSVICLGGPLSHLRTQQERKKAINELIRVAKKNALIFISVIGKLGVLIGCLRYWPKEILYSNYLNVVNNGDDNRWHYDLEGHYVHYFLPEELKKLLTRKDAKIIEMAGLQSLSTHSRAEVNKLSSGNQKIWNRWKDTHLKFCTRPESIGISEHMMIICIKK